MLKRPSKETTCHGKAKQVKCSHLQEQIDASETEQAEPSLDSRDLSMDVDDDGNEVTSQSTIVKESITGNNDGCRPFAENVLRYQIEDLKKKGNSEMELIRYCCALLNAGGGVLEMPIANIKKLTTLHYDLDKFWQRVEPNLNRLIEPQSYADVFDRTFDGSSGEVHLFIKGRPNHIYTRKFHLFSVADSGTYEASYNQVKNVMTKKHANLKGTFTDLPTFCEEFVNGERVGFLEGKQIQLKHYESKQIFDPHSNHKQCDNLRRAISSFANGTGGIIFVGVTDDGVAKGQNLEGDSKEAIVERVNTLINKLIWPPNVNPVQGEHWDIKFFPLRGKDNYFVIVIYVVRVSGGVFMKLPESFEFQPCVGSSKEQVRELSFDEWHYRMVNGTDVQDSKGVDEVTSRFTRISLGGPKQLLTVERGVEEVRQAFFEVRDDWHVTPEGALSKLPQDAQAVIKQVQRFGKKSGSRGLILFSRSWLRNVGPGVRPNGPGARPKGLICDLLLISQGVGGLHLVSLCEPGSEEEATHYSLRTARGLKRFLQFEGGCDDKFYVSNHVVPCRATTNLDGLDIGANSLYPEEYDMKYTPDKLNSILDALVIVLAKVPSSLSSSMGVTFMNLLTPLQFQLVHEKIDECECKELWIKGPAGSGKTLVAVEFMRELLRRDEHLEKDNVLYVCENKGLREQVRRADVCECVCRKTFMTSYFRDVKHVIMDEVQNFTAEDGDWLLEARKLVRTDGRDEDPGYLWLFIDNSQLNHSYEVGVPKPSQQVPFFRLKKVIRNSKRIFDYSMQFMPDKAKLKIELGHDFCGDEVQREKHSRGKSRLICLNRVLTTLFNEGFSKGDVVILYGKEDCIPKDMSIKLGLTIVTAEENNSNYLVVSTFRKYSGLERPVVVTVDLDKSLPYGSIPLRSMYCAVTRAMVKLVVIQPE